MERGETHLECRKTVLNGLDHELVLALALHRSPPAIHGLDTRHDLHARGEGLTHDGLGDTTRVGFGANGRHDDEKWMAGHAKTRYSATRSVPIPPAATSSNTTAFSRRAPRVVRAVLVVSIAVVAIDAVVGERGLLDRLKAGEESRVLEAALAHARAENAALADHARRLRQDPAAIEEVARREFGFIMPGEKLFILKDVRPETGNRSTDR